MYDGINVDVLHAERTAAQRDDVVRRFRTGEVWVLIATDIAARGLDFKGVNMVINYDLPSGAVRRVARRRRGIFCSRASAATTSSSRCHLVAAASAQLAEVQRQARPRLGAVSKRVHVVARPGAQPRERVRKC